MTANRLHHEALVIDMTCPLARDPSYVDWWREGGADVIAPTILGFSASAKDGLTEIGAWHRYCRTRDDAMIVLTAADIEAAYRNGKMGLILHSQGT